MNFSKSFTYMFDDPDWASKYTIGIVISLVPILNLAWMGYAIGIMRNMASGMQHPLPAWDNVGEKFKDGLLLAIASFIYTLPLTLLVCVVSVIPAILSGNGNSSDMVDSLAAAGMMVVMCCGLVYLLVFSFFYPAMMLHYSRQGNFGALFQINEIIRLATRNISDYLMGWLAGLVAAIILSVVAVIPCIGQLVAMVAGAAWINTVTAHAYGQVGLKLGPPPVEGSFTSPAY